MGPLLICCCCTSAIYAMHAAKASWQHVCNNHQSPQLPPTAFQCTKHQEHQACWTPWSKDPAASYAPRMANAAPRSQDHKPQSPIRKLCSPPCWGLISPIGTHFGQPLYCSKAPHYCCVGSQGCVMACHHPCLFPLSCAGIHQVGGLVPDRPPVCGGKSPFGPRI